MWRFNLPHSATGSQLSCGDCRRFRRAVYLFFIVFLVNYIIYKQIETNVLKYGVIIAAVSKGFPNQEKACQEGQAKQVRVNIMHLLCQVKIKKWWIDF